MKTIEYIKEIGYFLIQYGPICIRETVFNELGMTEIRKFSGLLFQFELKGLA